MTTSPEIKLGWREIVRDPVLLLAHGLGSGLAPKAPGTFGTLAALLPWLWLAQLPALGYWALILAALLGGIWLCGEAAQRMGNVADPGGIVWDEWVGVWIALAAVPDVHLPLQDWGVQWLWVLAAFLLFRMFDILKPGPIGWCDRHLHGGLGIMLDDIAAGIAAFLLLQCAQLLMGLLVGLL
ncbi:MAG: phosphatidylglycerophosphatase A [Pseudomonadota bacterium]